MLRIFFATLLVFSACLAPSFGDPPQGVRQGRNNRNLKPMARHLALTADQMRRIRIASKSYPAGPDRDDAIKEDPQP